MVYSRPRFLWIPTYELSSCGKHGERYKKEGGEEIPILRMSIETCKIDQFNFGRFAMMSDNL